MRRSSVLGIAVATDDTLLVTDPSKLFLLVLDLLVNAQRKFQFVLAHTCSVLEISCMCEIPRCIRRHDDLQCNLHVVNQPGTSGCGENVSVVADEGFDLGEGLLDWVEVWRVRR